MTDPINESESRKQQFQVEPEQAGERLDVFLMSKLAKISRVKIGRLINQEQIKVNQQSVKPSYRVRGEDCIDVSIPPPEPMGSSPEKIDLDILFEDDHVVAINKPAAMVVHPAKGNWKGTLTAALSYHFTQLSKVGGELRPGIVHRLDRDTTGVILVAKNDEAHMNLTRQFESRTVQKKYLAIVSPSPDRDRDLIREPIGVHPYQREKMAVRSGHRTSRDAETFFEVVERFKGFALVKAFPKTGRTHQIRIHLTHMGCPVLCDRLYSGRSKIDAGMFNRSLDPEPAANVILDRQALHASTITFQHPFSDQELTVEAPLPADFELTLEQLREFRKN